MLKLISIVLLAFFIVFALELIGAVVGFGIFFGLPGIIIGALGMVIGGVVGLMGGLIGLLAGLLSIVAFVLIPVLIVMGLVALARACF